MSVILFGLAELANIAAAVQESYSTDADLRADCEALARISKANAVAWTATYYDPEDWSENRETPAEPVSAKAIYRAAKALPQARLGPACRAGRLLHYNCVSNGGHDASEDMALVQADLVGILGSLLTKASDLCKFDHAMV